MRTVARDKYVKPFTPGTILTAADVFPSSENPYYRKGMWISAAMCLMVAMLCVALDLHLWRENKKLDLLDEQAAAAPGDVELEKQGGKLATRGRFRYMY